MPLRWGRRRQKYVFTYFFWRLISKHFWGSSSLAQLEFEKEAESSTSRIFVSTFTSRIFVNLVLLPTFWRKNRVGIPQKAPRVLFCFCLLFTLYLLWFTLCLSSWSLPFYFCFSVYSRLLCFALVLRCFCSVCESTQRLRQAKPNQKGSPWFATKSAHLQEGWNSGWPLIRTALHAKNKLLFCPSNRLKE